MRIDFNLRNQRTNLKNLNRVADPPKNQLQLSVGLNLETLNTISIGTMPYLSRSNSLNSASENKKENVKKPHEIILVSTKLPDTLHETGFPILGFITILS